jgi:hypothetical protein
MSTSTPCALCAAAVAFAALCSTGAPAAAQDSVKMYAGRSAYADYHVVEQGDTLYDLAGRYFGDTQEWPRLWSYNPHVTNPHWIYPGDIIYLRPLDPSTAPPRADAPQRVQQRRERPMELHVAVAGFVHHKELPYVGRIVASPKQATLLGEHDKVWVGFGDKSYTSDEQEEIPDDQRIKMKDPGDLRIGDMFAIVRKDGEVRDGDDNVLGHKYIVLGSLRITELSDKYLQTAEITQSWMEIERGALLVPYERQIKTTSPVQAERNMVASISDTIEPRTNLGEYHYVIVDKGADNGVRVGNRFFAYQRQEGILRMKRELEPHGGMRLIQDTPKEIPWMRVGQIIILDVRKNYSTGIVVDSSRELLRGDRLEMYEGY